MQTQNSQQNSNQVNHKGSFICQICQQASMDINICNLCSSFCCQICKIDHMCTNSQEKYKKMSESIQFNDDINDFQIDRKKFKQNQFQKKRKSPNGSKISCERCSIKCAQLFCLKCKIKYLCPTCFKEIHSSSKLSTHEYQEIEIQENGSFYDEIFQKIVVNTNDISKNKRQKQFQQITSMLQYDLLSIQAQMNKMTHATNERKSLSKNKRNEMLKEIQRNFDTLVDMIKLKKDQLTIKIQQWQQSDIHFYQEITKFTKHHQTFLNNIDLMKKYDLLHHISQNSIKQKRQRCQKQMADFINNYDQNNFKESTDNFAKNFPQYIKNISQKINEIETKRLFEIQNESRNSVLIHSTLQNNYYQTFTQMNQKNIKNQSYFLSTKSKSKKSSMTSSLISPKKSQRTSLKTSPYQQNIPVKSLFNQNNKLKTSTTDFKFTEIKNTIHTKQYQKMGTNKLIQADKARKNTHKNSHYPEYENRQMKKMSKQLRFEMIRLQNQQYFSCRE